MSLNFNIFIYKMGKRSLRRLLPGIPGARLQLGRHRVEGGALGWFFSVVNN
jgi:hypothetical protein